MSSLPDPSTLARLVSNVTETMCHASFVPAGDSERGESVCGRMALLPIRGSRDISIVLSCDQSGARALAAGLFGCPLDEVSPEMTDDAVAELLNMVGGQITSAMSLDQALGLPRRTSLAELAEGQGVGINDSVLLRSEGSVDLKLWIFERAAVTPPKVPSGSRRWTVRSLIQKLNGAR